MNLTREWSIQVAHVLISPLNYSQRMNSVRDIEVAVK